MALDPLGLAGTTIDSRYRIDTLVGEGGFGVVYRGHHLGFDHAVAIKVLKLPDQLDPSARALFFERFRAEGKLLARLQHPSIVRVFDVGTATSRTGVGLPYLVLEWLEGQTLEAVLESRRGLPFGEAEAITLLRGAMEGLAHAHLQEPPVAHRDVKPANVFVLHEPKRGLVTKILDFGIAKVMLDNVPISQGVSQTSSGFSAFSPRYGAPEQVRPTSFGESSPRTDVHAVGLLLTELVTAKPAFDTDDLGGFVLSVLGDARPTPRSLGAPVSDGFERVVTKALALQPSERFADVRELLGALDVAVPIAHRSNFTVPMTRPVEQAHAVSKQRATSGRLMIWVPLASFVAAGLGLLGGHLWRGSAAKTELEAASDKHQDELEDLRRDLVKRHTNELRRLRDSYEAVERAEALLTSEREDEWDKADKLLDQAAGTPERRVVLTKRLAKLRSERTLLRGALKSVDMVYIPGGTFKMGDADWATTSPVHKVTLLPYSIDRTEVTVAKFRQCVAAGACLADDKTSSTGTGSNVCNFEQTTREEHPMNCVSYTEARKFCAFVGKRLPTEAEWELAARGLDGRKYPWGDTEPTCAMESFYDATTSTNCSGKTSWEVGKHPSNASPYGVLDLAGNVSEWVYDGSGAYSASDAFAPTGPTIRTSGIVRGGNWEIGDWDGKKNLSLRGSFRRPDYGDSRYHWVGFRCAK